ncbi:protein aveugle-like [Watersipora subatra]|uniref:protein aveugle-like n=1 Tax=Watersipora subatra TaxID=2589382 RepID=UPI00355AFA0E
MSSNMSRVSTSSSSSRRVSKQKPLCLWTADDVLHWLKKHMGEGYFLAYGDMFREHSITGKTLQRLNDSGLVRMGMINRQHRNELLTKITILKLKSEIVEMQASLAVTSGGAA